MKKHLFCGIAATLLLGSCTSGQLSVGSVDYQSLRTDFAQPSSIPKDAKIAVEYFFNSEGRMQPVVYNLTSEILMLDQTKSFVIMPDGSSMSYYDPTVRTTTTGTYSSETTGGFFNLGGIAGALGIGGPLGMLLGATTVGSSHTDGLTRQNSVSITDQPQVYIGPKGSIAMSKAYAISGVGETAYGNNIIDVSPKTSPVRFSVCVTYSLDDGATFEKLVTNIYVSSRLSVPVSDRKVSKAFYDIYGQKPDALAENLFMFLIPNNIKAETTDVMGEFLTHSNVYDTYIQGSLIDFQ